MTRAERVVFRLVTTKKSGQSTKLLEGVKLITATRQYLVGVSLVADIPDEPVVWGIKNVVHRHGQLDGAEAGARVTADAGTRVYDELANLVSDFLQVFDPQTTKVGRRIDFRQKSHSDLGTDKL
jgi:hypothetical protein